MKKIISSLDVGSNTIKLIVGEMYKDKLNVLACCESKSKGIKRGLIVSPEEFFVSLKEVIEKAENIIGVKIKKIIACVPAYYTEFVTTEGYTLITREDQVVNGDDIIRALQACVYNKINPNKELVLIMPTKFILDDEKKVKDPKGERAHKLSVETSLAIVPKKNVYPLLNMLESLGIRVSDISFNTLCDYYEFKTEAEDKTLGAIINIGTEITEVSIIDKGILNSVEVLPLGGKSIDKDIMYIYNVYRKDAVLLKEKFALAHKKNAKTNETEEILTKDNKNIKINQYEVSEIVYARIKEILELAKKQINLLTNEKINYIIITGGTSELSDFESVVNEVFTVDVKLPKVEEFGVRNNKYSSGLGIIKYYTYKLKFRNKTAATIDEEEQQSLFSTKKKFNNNNLLGKIYGYFFDN